ncbi:MAG TPA: MmcQ/YjbR family DNA-binding protein [Bryobacteraceae bacterium]|jgi:hypothetical protein|nr:MmcQ/YjbR family DNA-binding protein [Bryobacteraceae bacterium]
MTYENVRKIGLSFPSVEEGTSYGTPALKVKKKLFVRLKEDGDSLVIGMPFERREALMAEDPEKYYITDHYLNYEYVLVRLSKVSEEELRDLLKGAYRAALPKSRAR